MHYREIGLRSARGNIAFGIFRKLKIGDKIFINPSISPELLKAPIATNKPIRVGNNASTIFIPSFAPSIKTSNILIPSFNP